MSISNFVIWIFVFLGFYISMQLLEVCVLIHSAHVLIHSAHYNILLTHNILLCDEIATTTFKHTVRNCNSYRVCCAQRCMWLQIAVVWSQPYVACTGIHNVFVINGPVYRLNISLSHQWIPCSITGSFPEWMDYLFITLCGQPFSCSNFSPPLLPLLWCQCYEALMLLPRWYLVFVFIQEFI